MVNNFFNRVIKDEEFIDCLLQFKTENWNKIDNDEKIKVCRTIGERINSLYPELGKCKFDFVCSNRYTSGNCLDDYIVIDVLNEKNNQFLEKTKTHLY